MSDLKTTGFLYLHRLLICCNRLFWLINVKKTQPHAEVLLGKRRGFQSAFQIIIQYQDSTSVLFFPKGLLQCRIWNHIVLYCFITLKSICLSRPLNGPLHRCDFVTSCIGYLKIPIHWVMQIFQMFTTDYQKYHIR